VSMGLDLTILILNDDAYGMIKWKQVRSLLSRTNLAASNAPRITFQPVAGSA
jgi:thiamine pyrophosphate-dependent acetolactate synthase large subunit-like protein